jgi:DNA polymerase (family 10)
MENKEIKKLLKLTADLLALHGDNAFKVRTYTNAAIRMDNLTEKAGQLDPEALQKLSGIGKGVAADIAEILQRGSFARLDALLEKTPDGVLDMLRIKGIGPGKVGTLWKELGITTVEGLLAACREGTVAGLKGFGQKTQDTIQKALEYIIANQDRAFYSVAEGVYLMIEEAIRSHAPTTSVSMSGQLRRKYEVIDVVEIMCGTDHRLSLIRFLDDLTWLTKRASSSGPFRWGGVHAETGLQVSILIRSTESFYSNLLLHTGSDQHLSLLTDGDQTLFDVAMQQCVDSEESAYSKIGMPYVLPEMREGAFEIEMCIAGELPEPLRMEDLKGSIHNHSTYSDGQNTVEEMAAAARDMGLEYLGMADHSKTAFYAGGLHEQDIIQQHREIDALNEAFKPFRLFKGIESDILNDGALDYVDDVLASFDFVVASVHSNLNMDIAKATDRLLKAIHHPYTTILGHPTGRLLLNREGYPIDHKAVIDACVDKDVVIEINANPWRLDLDWRWIRYGIDRGALFSINPDAHETIGLHDMYYGVCIARKAGLTPERTLNAKSRADIEAYFRNRKEKIGL